MQEKPLANKTVLITGASRRIGRGLARACAESGADVIVHYRHSRELADETVRLVVESGRSAWALHADFSRAADVSRLAEAAFSIAPVYALVNNAAVFGEAGFADTNLEDWENHLAINLTAPMLLSQAFGRFVGPGGEGRIVNILDWRAATARGRSFRVRGVQGCAFGHDPFGSPGFGTRDIRERTRLGRDSPTRGGPSRIPVSYDVCRQDDGARWMRLARHFCSCCPVQPTLLAR